MYSSAHVTNSLHDPSIIQQRNTGAISRDSYRTSRNLRQSDVDRISNFEFAHVVSNFCDCTSTVITNFVREAIFVTIVICLAREVHLRITQCKLESSIGLFDVNRIDTSRMNPNHHILWIVELWLRQLCNLILQRARVRESVERQHCFLALSLPKYK